MGSSDEVQTPLFVRAGHFLDTNVRISLMASPQQAQAFGISCPRAILPGDGPGHLGEVSPYNVSRRGLDQIGL